jgi:hypothetical protein
VQDRRRQILRAAFDPTIAVALADPRVRRASLGWRGGRQREHVSQAPSRAWPRPVTIEIGSPSAAALRKPGRLLSAGIVRGGGKQIRIVDGIRC